MRRDYSSELESEATRTKNTAEQSASRMGESGPFILQFISVVSPLVGELFAGGEFHPSREVTQHDRVKGEWARSSVGRAMPF
jgi:hypothetical protein